MDEREYVMGDHGRVIPLSEFDRSRPGYTRAYFDDGVGLSNYRLGYDKATVWDQMHPVALLLREYLLPRSVVEFGCAKGVLVGCFRELGVEAVGYDASEYAVGEADEAVRPYLRVADVASRDATLSFTTADLAISMEMLEHVPEGDVPTALRNIRMATGDWCFLTIHLRDPNAAGPEVLHVDLHDLTHRTLAPRAWWNDRLEEAGFAPAGIMEAVLARDPWIVRNGWKVFLRRPLESGRVAHGARS